MQVERRWVIIHLSRRAACNFAFARVVAAAVAVVVAAATVAAATVAVVVAADVAAAAAAVVLDCLLSSLFDLS